jgi:voltage-gated potassium channel
MCNNYQFWQVLRLKLHENPDKALTNRTSGVPLIITATQKRLRATLGDMFSKAPSATRLGLWVNGALLALILLNAAAVILESVTWIREAYSDYFTAFELFSVAIFTAEYVARVWSAPDNNDLGGASSRESRQSYIFSFTGLIDFMAILPSLLQLFGVNGDLRVLRVLRMARLLKLSHYTSALEDLASAIYSERKAFLAAMYIICVALFMSSSLIYLVENEAQPDAFPSIPETMWWSIITLTTVGYGDVSPVTGYGKLIGGATAMIGVCSVALLTGIVGAGFSKQISKHSDALNRITKEATLDGKVTDAEIHEIRKIANKLGMSDDILQELIEESLANRSQKNTGWPD